MTTPSFDKPAFFKDMGYEPHNGQQLVHDSVAPRRVLACGVRWGKSRCAAMEAIAAAMEPRERSMGWVVAPTYDLAEKCSREVFIIAAEHLRHRIIKLKESEKKLVLRNLAGGVSEIRGKSADNPVSLLGEGLDWVIIDEASRLKPTIYESHLSQRLIDKKGWLLAISTPRGKGWFYDLFRLGQGDDPQYESWNAPSWQNPHLDRDLIEAERERLPERVFRQEYGAEFLEGSGAVFRYVREAATGEFQEPTGSYDDWYFAGLDLAKSIDHTVLVIMNARREVVHFDRFHRLDWGLQISRVAEAAMKYNNANILVDSTGKGEPVYERLCEEDLNVDPYTFTQKSKAALIDNLAMMLERKQIVLPKRKLCPVLVDELEAFQYSVTDSGNVKSGAPSGQHDDAVIALALAAWQLQEDQDGPAISMYYVDSLDNYLR